MEQMAALDGIVTGFHVTEHYIDCMCGKNLVKIDKATHEIIFQKPVFEKEGLSRKLAADEQFIFVYDFCTLYVFRMNLSANGSWAMI